MLPQEIGKGAQANVHECINISTGKVFAVKVASRSSSACSLERRVLVSELIMTNPVGRAPKSK